MKTLCKFKTDILDNRQCKWTAHYFHIWLLVPSTFDDDFRKMLAEIVIKDKDCEENLNVLWVKLNDNDRPVYYNFSYENEKHLFGFNTFNFEKLIEKYNAEIKSVLPSLSLEYYGSVCSPLEV